MCIICTCVESGEFVDERTPSSRRARSRAGTAEARRSADDAIACGAPAGRKGGGG